MFWTWPTAAFFIVLALAITFMGVWDSRTPSLKHKGFLPIPFTRGERFFINVVILIGVTLIWLAVTDANPLYAVAIAVVIDGVIDRYG